jgi:hypothetical protein
MKMLEKKRSAEGKKIDRAEEQKLRCIIVS